MTSSNKHVANTSDVDHFLASLPDAQQRQDAEELISLMSEISGQEPVMWGTSIVGFGSVHYRYESGREGDMPAISFSPRKGKFALYLTEDAETLVAEHPGLGKHKIGKGCIYINKLADVDPDVLNALVRNAWRARFNGA